MAKLDQEALAQIVNVVLASLHGQAASPRTAPSVASPVDRLAQKDRALVAGLKRKGIKEADIQLMDRANPAKPFNVKPYKLWMQEGRMVQKGQHGIRGLFHISQTSPIAPAKPAAKVKAKPAKAQTTTAH